MKFVVIGGGFLLDCALKTIDECGGEIIGVFTSDETKHTKYGTKLPTYPSAEINTTKHVAFAEIDETYWLVSAESTVIIKPDVLSLFPDRAINFHPGVLPAYGGLYSYQWAIRNGEKRFGSTIHLMNEVLDAGDILAEEWFEISPTDTGLSVYQKCIRAGAKALSFVLRKISSGGNLERRQQDLATRRIYNAAEASESMINWQLRATEIVDFIRAGNFAPLRSPTYVATLEDGTPVHRAEVVESAPHEATAGTVLEANENAVVVKAGDGRAVRILN